MELRLPPLLDKRAVGQESYTLCGGVETITHRENGVMDEEELNEGTAAFTDESGGWSLACEIQRRTLVSGLCQGWTSASPIPYR